MNIRRHKTVIRADARRVLLRAYEPGEQRFTRVISRVMSLSEPQVRGVVRHVERSFARRHLDLRGFLRARFDQCHRYMVADTDISEERRLLIGALFTMEYSPEAAALFNPSMVAHVDNAGTADGDLRFILSLRATGEGHISSIEFCEGTLTAAGDIRVDARPEHRVASRPIEETVYHKELFERKLREAGYENAFTQTVLAELPEGFRLDEVEAVVRRVFRRGARSGEDDFAARAMMLLAQSNYEVEFPEQVPLGARVIFPNSPTQINGIEDARFVLFREDDGTQRYYATYTAYDGKIILPQLLETSDFRRFRFITLNGPAVRNKGMALFPRRINGQYAMLARQDDESISLMTSEHLHFWYDSTVIARPSHVWEYDKIGNCGSPIETQEGWLVITHGVGPLRQYCMGAILLDLADPTRVVGRLRDPLLRTEGTEREGYTPNVVYSCGSLVHRGMVVIPFGISDCAVRFATVSLDALLSAMR